MKFDVSNSGLTTYTTVDGDVLDLIAFAFYGDHEGTTEFLLASNPGLADRGSVYPAGVVITLPYRAPTVAVTKQISLWD